MITRLRSFYPLLFLLVLATFTAACGEAELDETEDTSGGIMFTSPDAEDTNYDNEVTVEQATPFSEETAVASESYSPNRDFGTQPPGPKPEKKLEYFNNPYRKAYSTSTTDQRAIVPGYKASRPPSFDYDDSLPYGYGKQDTAAGKKTDTSAIKSAEWPRSNNPTDYVKPDSTRRQ